MIIMMPLTAKVEDGGELVEIGKLSLWAFVDLNEGKVQNIEYFKDKDEYTDWFDIVVVVSKDDDIESFIEESIPVLESPFTKDFDEVIEAFLFKDLFEITPDDRNN